MRLYHHSSPAKYSSLMSCAGLILGWIGLSSCTERDDSKVADAFRFELVAPWWLRPESKEAEQAREFQAMAQKRNRADPRLIPETESARVAAMIQIEAESLESLLAVTGLTPYQENLFIVFLGTYQQELWVYYRIDAALFAPFDPVSRKIVGQVQNFSSGR